VSVSILPSVYCPLSPSFITGFSGVGAGVGFGFGVGSGFGFGSGSGVTFSLFGTNTSLIGEAFFVISPFLRTSYVLPAVTS